MTINITAGGMFWLFMTIFFCLDTFVYMQGFDTTFWNYKTPEEKQIQKIKIENMKHDGVSKNQAK